MRRIKFLLILVFLAFQTVVSAAIIWEGWDDPHAYRPTPILFLHGFAQGNPADWTKSNVDTKLNEYFAVYYKGYAADNTILTSTRFPYLEIIDFGGSLVDRNSSVDTYKIGDRYVVSHDRNPGDPGWADTVNTIIDILRDNYRYSDGSMQKINLVCHSMGGLAARKYFKSYSNSGEKLGKLIIIGTPNLGSSWATSAVSFSRSRRWGWILPSALVYVIMIETLDETAESFRFIDIDGDAVWDMDPAPSGSGFLNELNTNYSTSIDHFAIAGSHWLDYDLGDTVVPLESQLGIGVLSLKGHAIINAAHGEEPGLSSDYILQFLDSTPPEIEITEPEEGKIVFKEPGIVNVIGISGKLYKEYLPADTLLNIQVVKADSGQIIYNEEGGWGIFASDLWIPGNFDSPVAEFQKTLVLTFPAAGTYTIKVQAVNATNIVSQEESVNISVLDPGITWSIGPYQPYFTFSAAMLSNSSATLSVSLGQEYGSGSDYPLANFAISNLPLPVPLGVPVSVSYATVVIDPTTVFADIGSTEKCQVTFSHFDNFSGGYISGVITGTLWSDLNHDGHVEYYSLDGPFEFVRVISD
ncbi:MAG: alpha/beta hydrolase [Candidatus Omnitrophota bacterium]